MRAVKVEPGPALINYRSSSHERITLRCTPEFFQTVIEGCKACPTCLLAIHSVLDDLRELKNAVPAGRC